MRPLVLAAALSLALAPALTVHAAEKCKDLNGKAVACPKPSSDEVTVTKPPKLNRPPTEPFRPGPADSIPAMATALCRDGTYSKAQQAIGACELHGGVAMHVR